MNEATIKLLKAVSDWSVELTKRANSNRGNSETADNKRNLMDALSEYGLDKTEAKRVHELLWND